MSENKNPQTSAEKPLEPQPTEPDVVTETAEDQPPEPSPPTPTSYFTVEELCASRTAVARGIKNVPNERQRKNLEELIEKLLNPLRKAIGLPIRVNSGFRNPALNKAVGGVSNSAHLEGLAVDIVCPQYKNGDVKEFALFIKKFLEENNIPYDQLIYERPRGVWVHLAYRHSNGKQREQILTIARRGTFSGIV